MSRQCRLMSIGPVFLVCSLGLILADNCGRKKPTPDQVIEARQKIGQTGNLLEGYVRDIKSSYAVNATEYVTARDKYRAAEAAYNAWLSNLAQGIREQTNLESPTYKKIGGEAEKLANDFLKYVGETRKAKGSGQEIPSLPILAPRVAPDAGDFFEGIIKAGITIWKAYKDGEETQRAKIAEQLKAEFQWKKWEAI